MQRDRFPAYLQPSEVHPYRVEMQSVPPKEYKDMQQMATQLQGDLLHVYGKYIHPRSLANNEAFSERIVVCDDVNFVDNSTYASSKRRHLKFLDFTVGFMDENTGVIFISDKESLEKNSSSLGGELGGKVARGELSIKTLQLLMLMHEMVHQYQDKTLPGLFQEMAAYNIAKKATQDTLALSDYLTLSWGVGYEKLLEKFGDDVHAVNFGTIGDFQKKRKILQEAPGAVLSACLENNVPLEIFGL